VLADALKTARHGLRRGLAAGAMRGNDRGNSLAHAPPRLALRSRGARGD
jgi:hypothetical protein